MNRLTLPLVAVVAACWATYSIARTQPDRADTVPPAPPAVSRFSTTVAAAGLVEPSSEHVAIGTPLAGLVTRVHVTPGQTVRAGAPLFELDTRQLRADLRVRKQLIGVAGSRVAVAEARVADLRRQLAFVEQISDTRAVSAEEVTRRRNAVDTAVAEVAQARAELVAAEAQAAAVEVEIDRSVVRSPLQGEVLQVKTRAGEYAVSPSPSPLILVGRTTPLHVRVDVDEQDAWRVRPDAAAEGHVRGNAALKARLVFVRLEPFVVPKRSLTGDSTERVDTRVLQVIYRVELADTPLLMGQQMDVFIDAAAVAAQEGR